jgi:hypothetical protein
VSTIVLALGTIALVLVTASYARQTHLLVEVTKEASDAARNIERERQQEEKRMLAGVLVAELREHFVWIKSVLNPTLSEVETRFGNEAMAWCLDNLRTGFFDSAGPHLFLLGPDLLFRTTDCYGLIRRTLDEARQAQSMAEYCHLNPTTVSLSGRRWQNYPAAMAQNMAHADALQTAMKALSAIEALLPDLSEVADIENPLQPDKEVVPSQ